MSVISLVVVFVFLNAVAGVYQPYLTRERVLEHEQDMIQASQYIIVLHEQKPHLLRSTLLDAKRTFGDRLIRQFQHALHGFVVTNLRDDELKALRARPDVKSVEREAYHYAGALQKDCSLPVEVHSWGLTRVSQQQIELDNTYKYPNEGAGVMVYVLDTGVYLEHEDFGGRAKFGFKSVESWSDQDKHGHGTHCASTCCGSEYGVARRANITAVKVLADAGYAVGSSLITGIDWVIGQVKQNKKPSVISFSIWRSYSPFDSAMWAALGAATDAGIVFSIIAGNANEDVCENTGYKWGNTIVVGATATGSDSSQNQVDIRSTFSNYGKCVDVFAPGTDITAAAIRSPSATTVMSGTSMAAPHVAGVAALLLAQGVPAAKVKTAIIDTANKGLIDFAGSCSNDRCKGSPNRLLYNGCG